MHELAAINSKSIMISNKLITINYEWAGVGASCGGGSQSEVTTLLVRQVLVRVLLLVAASTLVVLFR